MKKYNLDKSTTQLEVTENYVFLWINNHKDAMIRIDMTKEEFFRLIREYNSKTHDKFGG